MCLARARGHHTNRPIHHVPQHRGLVDCTSGIRWPVGAHPTRDPAKAGAVAAHPMHASAAEAAAEAALDAVGRTESEGGRDQLQAAGHGTRW